MERGGYAKDVFSNGYVSQGANIGYGILALYLVHQALVYFDYPVLSLYELLWNALVYFVPTRILLDAEKREQLREVGNKAQMQAAKSEAVRRMLGWGTGALSHKLVGGEGLMRRMSLSYTSDEPTTDAPPGLGNWDNSCYQNSVLQGLASLGSLKEHLGRVDVSDLESTSGSLRETVGRLNDAANNGKQLWTPAKLKSMSSWQQQDAQEYFSKIMDELDKDAAGLVAAKKARPGLETVVEEPELQAEKTAEDDDEPNVPIRNPLEGLLAQRVACTRCGFSEGLSMIPFNCLTVPLGSEYDYDIADCLDEYTKLEEINDVDCPKCTLLRSEGQLKQMVPPSDSGSEANAEQSTPNATLGLPPELRELVAKRLQAIQHALENAEFSDKTLNEVCQIPKKAHVSSTKTRQAVIGRTPRSLVAHINRSVFDELTGVQRKNHASVRYPMVLDLSEWILDHGSGASALQSMLADGHRDACLYRLMAVVTHYGRHENGHYICYRRHPSRPRADLDDSEGESVQEPQEEQWWRLSDEDVSAVSEDNVLGQGGVFMLFYEREETAEKPSAVTTPGSVETIQEELPAQSGNAPDPIAAASIDGAPLDAHEDQHPPLVTATPLTPDSIEPDQAPVEPPSQIEPQTSQSTTAEQPSQPVRKVPSPPLMRTSRGRHSSRQGSMGEAGFGTAFRAVTAS